MAALLLLLPMTQTPPQMPPPRMPPPQLPPPSLPPGALYNGGVTVNVLGQSGKMTLSNGPNSVTVEMDNLFELDASGSMIGNTGPNDQRHSRNTFASVAFTINSMPRRSSQYGVPADTIDFSTTLLDSSQLSVASMIFLQDGIIKPTANESWTVAGGTIKFSVNISSWPFCSGESTQPCNGATGAFLQFGMQIKGSADASLPNGAKRYTLARDAYTGKNISLELSDEVYANGKWLRMPAGYPRFEMQGSKQLFTFRFPRFTGSALYDPVIAGLETVLSPPPPPSSSKPPPSPGASTNNPCFPGSAMVTLADGTAVRIDQLQKGDLILAATSDGAISTDEINFLSIVKPKATATFVTLATDSGRRLSLTAEHHIPVGTFCCSDLKTAKEVLIGETVWLASTKGPLKPSTIVAIGSESNAGLHSPVLTNGGFPIVNGFVTAFDSITKVTMARFALTYLTSICEALNQCDRLRLALVDSE